jgi:hypothetical protein
MTLRVHLVTHPASAGNTIKTQLHCHLSEIFFTYYNRFGCKCTTWIFSDKEFKRSLCFLHLLNTEA